MANSNVNVAGYPTSVGSKNFFLWDHYGPASYTQYSASSPAGDTINASDLGFGGLDEVNSSWAAYSNSGNYIVQVMPVQANDIPAGSAGKRVAIQWFTTSAAFGAKSSLRTNAQLSVAP